MGGEGAPILLTNFLEIFVRLPTVYPTQAGFDFPKSLDLLEPLIRTGCATMLRPTNLKGMSIDRLFKLREQVDAAISAKSVEARRDLQDRLSRLDRLANGPRARGVGRSGLRGAVPPKYRNPENPAETWARRGLTPRWLVAAIKSGKKLEHFAIGAAQKKLPAKRKKKA